MTELALFGAIALSHLLAVMSPGPDFAMVSRQTLAHGRGAGLLTALGIASGIVVHVGWALFGLGELLGRQPLLLEGLRWAGAGFLLWMGLSALNSAPASAGAPLPLPQPRPAGRAYAVGVATNLLNPKAMLYFVALCSVLLTRPTSLGLKLAVAAWIVLSTAAWFSLVALSLGHPAVRRRLLAQAHWLDRGMGLLLIALAGLMLLG
ncbi:MAG TPA: LysE family transporter [Nevskiaceae bacterium]|nr:LysE family transporter [Nevskiaceae bacterium]